MLCLEKNRSIGKINWAHCKASIYLLVFYFNLERKLLTGGK